MRKSTKSSREEDALQEFVRIFNMIRRVNHALAHASEESALLQEFCKILVETGGYAFAWVGLAEAEKDKGIVPVASFGTNGDFLAKLTFTWDDSALGRSPTGAAMRTGQPAVSQDLGNDPDFEPWREESLARGFASCLALPLADGPRPLGVLTLFADRTGAFEAAEVELLSSLAEALTFGLEALRARKESQRCREELALKDRMLDFASEALFVHDLAGRFLQFNQATYRELGYSPDELRQLNRFQLEPPEFAKLQEERLQELLARGETVFPSAHFRKDGSVIPLNLRSCLLEKDGQKVILSAAQDATRLRQAAAALKQAEERYRNILARARLGVFRLRLSDGRMEEANPQLAEIFGYGDLNEFLNDFLLTKRFVDPGTQQKMFVSFKNGELDRFEARCTRKDGSIVWIRMSARLSPATGYIEGVLTDISETKKLEEDLHKAEEKYRVLVEQQLGRSLLYAMERNRLKQEISREKELTDKLIAHSEDGIVAFDRNFRITLWNDGMEAITGLSRKKLLGKGLLGILPFVKDLWDSNPDLFAGPVRNILDSHRPMRLSPLSPEGYFNAHFFPLKNEAGEAIGGLIVVRDLTALRKAEEALKEREQREEDLKKAEERYRLIVNSLPLIGARAYADGAMDFYDDKIEKLTGFRKEDFDSRRLRWSELLGEEAWKNRLQAIARASQSDGSYTLDYRIETKEGKSLWLQESGHVSLKADGSLDHIDLVLFDITERKRNEEMAPKLEAQLRQAQRMEAIGTLAGGIAHDFNNILGVMLGYAEMALYSLKEDGDLKRKLQQILKAGQRGKDLVSQILAFSRPGKPERKPIKVSPIIKETLKMLRATVPATIELVSQVDEEKDTILADPTQIHQVLLNLCANAAHAMREKGGVLEVAVQAVDLDEAAAAHYHELAPGPYVMIKVKDTGHGMSKEVMERIFDPFFTTKAPGEGTGMGLAVVHGILKAHGGAITVQSEPGKGTEFQVFLPRITESPAPGLRERPRPDKGFGNILFVDDEEWLVEMWQEILENMGYEVEAYKSSHEALEAFRARPEKYHLVITDQTMAHMTGFELAKEMLRIRPDIPIILCTGYSEVVSPEKAKEAGIREYVMKPLSISELTGAIRRALGTESTSLKP
uniref:histidine kinase n=1 Tax=Desulfobacca acetoxidans TaxID=60893 RepID=A0A7C3SHL5_9BACT